MVAPGCPLAARREREGPLWQASHSSDNRAARGGGKFVGTAGGRERGALDGLITFCVSSIGRGSRLRPFASEKSGYELLQELAPCAIRQASIVQGWASSGRPWPVEDAGPSSFPNAKANPPIPASPTTTTARAGPAGLTSLLRRAVPGPRTEHHRPVHIPNSKGGLAGDGAAVVSGEVDLLRSVRQHDRNRVPEPAVRAGNVSRPWRDHSPSGAVPTSPPDLTAVHEGGRPQLHQSPRLGEWMMAPAPENAGIRFVRQAVGKIFHQDGRRSRVAGDHGRKGPAPTTVKNPRPGPQFRLPHNIRSGEDGAVEAAGSRRSLKKN